MTDQLMQLVAVENGEPRTTTLAIAEGMDVEHKAVIQLVRNYRNDLEEFGRVTFETRPFETAGGIQTREITTLNEQQATLIMTYMKNTEIARSFKKRLVKAFFELAHAQIAPTTPEMQIAQAMILAGRMIEEQKMQIEQRDKLIAVVAPKAAVADRLSGADGLFNLRNAAKALKIKEHEFIKWLQVHGWCFRNKKGRLEGYSGKVPRYLEHKVTPIPIDGDADRVSLQVMVTAEGLTKLAQIFNTEVELQEAA